MSVIFSSQALLRHLNDLPSTGRYRVAFSGGLDSHVLLHAMAALRGQLGEAELLAAHVNHGLLPQAEEWTNHCEGVCKGLGITCELLEVDARPQQGESPEAAARTARYAAFSELMDEGEMLLTAHHQDDQAETLLLHLLRGSGPRGLAGMPRWRPLPPGLLGRPLLGFPRSELRSYAESHRLSWVDDPSNREDRFARNFLRNELLPGLKGRYPQLSALLARAAGHQAEAVSLMDALAEADLERVGADGMEWLDIPLLERMESERQSNLIRFWLRKRGLPTPAGAHLDRIKRNVLGAATGREPLVCWPGAEVRRYRDRLYAMTPLVPPEPALVETWNPPEPLSLPWGRIEVWDVVGRGLRRAALDGATVEVSFRRGGERCRPQGRGHSQSLKRLFQEYGVPPWQRDRVPLIHLDGELAAVGDLWVCEPFYARPGEPGLEILWRNG